MSNHEKHEKGLVPRLRFPEFRGAGEWEGKVISELTPLGKKYGIVDGPFGSNLKTIHYKTEGIPIITSGYVTDGFFNAQNYLYVTKEKFEKEKRSAVQGGDIVMAKIGARCGASAIMPISHETGILSGNALKIKVDEGRYSSYFVWQQLWYQYSSKKLDVLKSIGAQPAISMANLKKYKLLFPQKKEEQEKIANCLSSIDELITAHSQKHAALKAHRKGLMQQLFPATGETTPKLRFSEFRDAGEWEEVDLGSVGKVSMCKRILKDETRPNGDIPFYKIGTFGKQADAYISREIYENYKSRYSYPKKGDILISASGTIGRLVVFDGAVAYFQDSNIVWIDNDESLVKNGFLFYCYENVKWATDDNTISRLYNDNLRRMKILITSISEQQKIANCLSSLDELIAAQSQKIESLKTHKKGLMQQLFPATDDDCMDAGGRATQDAKAEVNG